MQSVLWILLAVLFVFIVYRNVVGRFVNPRGVIIEPLVVVAAGIVVVVVTARSAGNWSGTAITEAAAGLALSAGLGVVRAFMTRLTMRQGRLFARGGAVVLGLWILTAGLTAGIDVLTAGTPAGKLTAATAVLSIGTGLAVQAATLVLRARLQHPDTQPVITSADVPR